MFDIGWSEMGLILMVALIVIGPKDLPRVARTVGKWTGKARAMAREFQRSLDDMAREAELQDIKAEMDKLSRTDVRHRIEETIDPEGELRRDLGASAAKPARKKKPAEAAAALPAPPAATPPAPVAAADAAAAPPPATAADPGEKS
jgi:sec-independent protein translocase protein TatB